MQKHALHVVLSLTLLTAAALLAAFVGLNCGSTAEEVRQYMTTQEYRDAAAEHLRRIQNF